MAWVCGTRDHFASFVSWPCTSSEYPKEGSKWLNIVTVIIVGYLEHIKGGSEDFHYATTSVGLNSETRSIRRAV